MDNPESNENLSFMDMACVDLLLCRAYALLESARQAVSDYIVG